MSRARPLDRRRFLASVAATGGGLALGFHVPFGTEVSQAAGKPPEITAWIVIRPDDTVIIRVARSEMGQGVSTALPMLVAEELECDWSKVEVEFPSPEENLRRKRAWGDFSTGGSRSIRNSQQMLRTAGATARQMLIGAAAARWQVDAAECRAAKGTIRHTPSGRTLRFGEVAEAAARIEPPKDVPLKDPKTWTLAGRPTRRMGTIDKVLGRPIYGIDVRLPGMLYAAIVHCPVFKGTLRSVDESAIAGMKGVRKVVRLDDAVAVVADGWWQAKKALDALAIVWDAGGNGSVSSASIRDFMQSGLAADEAGVGRQEGDLAAGFARAARRIEADYEVPFLAHATMEPQNCTAHVTGDTAEIWVPTQNGEAALATAARTLGLPPASVKVHKCMLGGGFGRRGAVQDFVVSAVLIAREVGRPVQTIWSREEDTRHDFFRPAAMARISAGLDGAGMPVAWHVRLSGNSIFGTLFSGMLARGVDRQSQEGFLQDMPYDVPNYLADFAMRNTHVPVGFWRCVSHTQNCFFRESFVDEMAHAAGADPYAYRRKLIGGHRNAARLIGVLDAAANRAGWITSVPGVHRGIAINESNSSFVAAVAEISIDDGHVRVNRMVVALDPGIVVNPMTVEEQVQSAVVFGLTAALYGEITIKNGGVEQSNFHDYEMLRMAQMPRVETVLVPSGGTFGGVGEPPVAVVAPAVCNAVFAAIGQRVRSLPLKKFGLRRA